MDELLRLDGRIALVTGASRGIGRATAILLAKLGADVIVHYATSRSSAEETAKIISSLNRNVYIVQADLSKSDDINKMFSCLQTYTKKLDILINNAGITSLSYLRYLKEDEWDNVLDVNLKGAYLCSKHAIRLMRQEGRIVNVSSIVVKKAGVCQVHYAASKGGLISLTKSMAKELASLGILVNAVAPGPVNTDMNMQYGRSDNEDITKQIPLKRIAEPEDVAKCIAYFCAPISQYITGQVLYVDGGLSL